MVVSNGLLIPQYREAEVKISINLFRAHKYIVDTHMQEHKYIFWERVLACCCLCIMYVYINFDQNRCGKYYAKHAIVLIMCWEFIGAVGYDAKIIHYFHIRCFIQGVPFELIRRNILATRNSLVHWKMFLRNITAFWTARKLFWCSI